MKKDVLFGLVVLALIVLPLGNNCFSQTSRSMIDPIVSTNWLSDNIGFPNLLILDVRNPDEYAKGHIFGAVNVPCLGNWYLNLFGKEFPWMELPEEKDLFATMGKTGITGNSIVVVVGRTADPMGVYAMADAARVAATIVYAGVKNVAILDGGYDKWAAEGRAASAEVVTPTPVTYAGAVLKKMFVSKDYVKKRSKKSLLVDARDADVYFGLIQEPWAQRPGHIPGAKCLATPWFWNLTKDKSGAVTYGTWKDANITREMALNVVGKDKSKEIIVYCGVGGYAGTLWFELHEVLGYTNVKIYDGSIQEWTADPKAPVVKYKCE
ncbi:MAG: rhodanese-like domain-containing protein [Syntrophales bacterium]|nr:rhodanese-like domain-containing protein [Syntrophales bacterium]